MSVKIIVDSASDITVDFANKNDIAFVPLKTNLGGVEYRDGIDIVPDVFFEKLEQNKELAHTSQVNTSEFLDVFEKVVADGDEAVVITLSSGLSGTYQSAEVAAGDYEGKIFVVDSLSATAGEQVLLYHALKLRDLGKTACEIYEELCTIRKSFRLLVCLETLEYLKRGGRISKTSALVGGIIGIKPILTLNEKGTLESVGKARGIKAGHKMLNDGILASGGIDFDYPVVVTYGGDLKNGSLDRYFEDSHDVYGDHLDQVIRGQLGCVIGTHAGPGAIVVSYVPKK
ncbi:MAG: DegV family protein [Ruminococcaceae bacterium]|nr:DegV family protein [Oscillospiraceae bacterium]